MYNALITNPPLQMSLTSEVLEYYRDPLVVAELQERLNTRVLNCPVLLNLTDSRDAGLIEDEKVECLTFGDLNKEDRNEISVYLGRILEVQFACLLARCDTFTVALDRSSSGDLSIRRELLKEILECKGTVSKDGWNGSTHASKKEDKPMNFVGVRYGIDNERNLWDVINGNIDLIDGLFIGVFSQLQFIRKGTATKSNSRTSLHIHIDQYETRQDEVAWGKFKLPQGAFKNKKVYKLQFEPSPPKV